MKTFATGMMVVLALAAVPAMASITNPHVAGSFQGWDPAANPMSEVSAGVWEASFTGLTPSNREEFKITNGTWDETYPGANSWLFTDADGAITITYDTNTYDDGWAPNVDRLGLSTDPGTWTAVGDWQGWDASNPATEMAAQGGGIYMYEQVFDPGEHLWKAVVTGSWDSISWDGRSINTANMTFVTDDVNDTARLWVNAFDGTVKVDVVPEPASLLGLALLGLMLRRR